MLFKIFSILYLIFFIVYFNKIVTCQYKMEQDKLIFYPDGFKTGYVANQEQIEQVRKSFKKIYLLNIAGYKKDVANIFCNSEKWNTPLERNIYRENLAKHTTWLEVVAILMLTFGVLICGKMNFLTMIIISLCTFFSIGNIVILKLKRH